MLRWGTKLPTPYVIAHLEDFFKVLRAIRENHLIETRSTQVSSMTFYRGHASSGWSLSPRLYREELHEVEQNLVKDALRIAPDEFRSLTPFQSLSKMQHLGLPTRLLDVTSNPLVALHFACMEHPGEDGEVKIFANLPTTSETGYPCKDVEEFVFRHSWSRFSVDDFPSRASATLPQDPEAKEEHRQSVEHTLSIPFAAVLPDNTNERLTAQAGAFLVCGMKVARKEKDSMYGSSGKEYWWFEPAQLSSQLGFSESLRATDLQLLIPAGAKSGLLAELEQVNINRWRLFPEAEHQMRYIYENYLSGRWRPPGHRAP